MSRLSDLTFQDRVRGCLLGGAIGDALGAGIEFLDLRAIRQRFGPSGVTGHTGGYGHPAPITDDTQMTLFTAEGLIQAALAGDDEPLTWLKRAYLRWFSTQQKICVNPEDDSGWLLSIAALHARRAPGSTCLSALAQSLAATSLRAANDSKGCGGVMRAAPCGLVAGDAFELGCAAAAITHGHPSGWLSAGALALIVQQVCLGEDLLVAVQAAEARLRQHPKGAECAEKLSQALDMAARPGCSPESVETLGGGWIGEEALAIAVCCALMASEYRQGVLLAVNHSGDSDSTGAIAGNILGALLGVRALPQDLLGPLELRAEIDQIALDVVCLRDSALEQRGLRERYLSHSKQQWP